MNDVIIVRFSEIHLKGKNKGYFLKLLKENIKYALAAFSLKVQTILNRIIIRDFNTDEYDQIVQVLSKVFGIFSFSTAVEMPSDIENIKNYVKNLKIEGSFKVDVNRADKSFGISSHDFNCLLGSIVLENNAKAFVDVKTPQTVISIDIRETGLCYIYNQVIYSLSGMPLNNITDGLLLLSGGIDSPVAGYLMAKRGMRQDILHFDSYPYTSPQAKQKVVSLAKHIKTYIGCKNMYIVSMTKLQEEFNLNCKSEYAITLLRRAMIKIAQILCTQKKYKAIITGESLGQVASQTIESITATNDAATTTPILRPLIGFNKSEIIEVAQKIKTYEISILPYEDCCTVFLPKNPIIKPKLENVKYEESKLALNELIDNVLSNMEIIKI